MFQRQEKSICSPFNRFYRFSLFQFIQSQYLEFHILSGRIWFAKMCHAPGNQTSVIVINKQKSIFVPLSHFSCFSLFQSIQWNHLFSIQYQCSQFQSFPCLCVWRVLQGIGVGDVESADLMRILRLFWRLAKSPLDPRQPMTLQLSFSRQSSATQIRNHLLQRSLCWYEMYKYIYIYIYLLEQWPQYVWFGKFD